MKIADDISNELVITIDEFDPIDALAKQLNSDPMWPNGEAPDISLSSNAAPNEVVAAAVKHWGFDRGSIQTFEIVEIRKIGLHAKPGCSASLMRSDLGWKILLFRDEPHYKTGFWWTRFYDAPEAEVGAVNGGQPVDSFRLPSHPPFTNTISASAQNLLGMLKPGMTRTQLKQHFGMDGGVQSVIVERYYLDDKAADGTVIMFELAFRPAKMDQATFADPREQADWLQAHRKDLFQPDDVVVAVGTPYVSTVHLD